MKIIPLTKGFVTKVDDIDFNYLNQWKWYAEKGGSTYYAARSSTNDDSIPYYNRKQIRMHLIILDRMGVTILCGMEGDHEDRDGLNNQRNNLRKATRSQNKINTIYKNTTGYRGVVYAINMKKFRVRISVNGKKKHIGFFDNLIDAAKCYDRVALKYHGEFAVTNFVY